MGPAKAPTRRDFCGAALLLLPAVPLWALHRSLDDWALYSEAEVLEANVLHPLFTSEEHFIEDYWRPEMRQRERLEAITLTLLATSDALQRVGISGFLESANLIGWLRHGGQVPWDTDGDLGLVRADCLAANVSKSALSEAVGPDYDVLKFACSCEEHCEGDDRRMVGRVAHRGTGVCVDIFAYGPVKQPRPWQSASRWAAVEWWERHEDHADYTFPREALLPLQNGTFAGRPVKLPRDPRDFLGWEYGRCLGTHVWPWRLLLYTPLSALVPTALVAKGAVLLSGHGSSKSPWLAAVIGAHSAVAMALFRNGVAALALLLLCCWELAATQLRPALVAPAVRGRHRLAVLAAVAVLLFELRGSMEQLICQVDDFHLRPRRPKTWTLCLLGRCWDF